MRRNANSFDVSSFSHYVCLVVKVLILYLILIVPYKVLQLLPSNADWPSLKSTGSFPIIMAQYYFVYFSVVCIFCIMVMGFCWNVLTITVFVCCPNLRSAIAIFITNHSLVDLMFCCTNLVFLISTFSDFSWMHGKSVCVSLLLLHYVNIGRSLLSLTAIAINRYILVLHPRLYPQVYCRRYIILMIQFIWLLPFGMVLPTLFANWRRIECNTDLLACSILTTDDQPKRFLLALGFLVPFVVIAFCYYSILRAVRRRFTRTDKRSLLETIAEEGDRVATRSEQEWRYTKMMVFISLSFFLCYLPVITAKIADSKIKRPEFHMAGYFLVFLSSCINPVIYAITSREYRQAYKSVLLCRFRRQFNARTENSTSTNPPLLPNEDIQPVFTLVSSPAGMSLATPGQ